MNNEIVEFELPNGDKGTYDDKAHKYYYNGREVPSVTTLIKEFKGNKYAFVDKELLAKAAEYGTNVHAELQTRIENLLEDPNAEIPESEYQEVNNYFKYIVPFYKVEHLASEGFIFLYDLNGEPQAAGRFDMVCYVNGELTLGDFKTTSTLQKQDIAIQLNLYARGLLQSGYIDEEQYKALKFVAIHLKKEKYQLVPITRLSDDLYIKYLI